MKDLIKTTEDEVLHNKHETNSQQYWIWEKYHNFHKWLIAQACNTTTTMTKAYNYGINWYGMK